MVFTLPSENGLLEDFCSSGKRQVRTQAPGGNPGRALGHLATRCCWLTCESNGTRCPGAGSCAGTQGMPPASGKDRLNKAPRPEAHATLYKEHAAQLKKAAFGGQATANHMVPSANHISAVPLSQSGLSA